MAADHDCRPEPVPSSEDRSDLLSPNRALRESVGASGSQRVGDNGPIANPEVTFPDDPASRGARVPADPADERGSA
jgi:hypothetical protein